MGNSSDVPEWAIDLAKNISDLARKVEDVKLISEENRRTLRGYNSTKGLVQKLESVEQSLEHIVSRTSELSSEIKNYKHDNDEIKQSIALINTSDYLSWKWIINKLGVPLMLTAATFFLMTLCPTMIVLSVLLPDIINLLTMAH